LRSVPVCAGPPSNPGDSRHKRDRYDDAASVALGEGIIELTFYGIRLMLLVVTRVLAGIWLAWVLGKQETLRECEGSMGG
jgi:hypothetical protein